MRVYLPFSPACVQVRICVDTRVRTVRVCISVIIQQSVCREVFVYPSTYLCVLVCTWECSVGTCACPTVGLQVHLCAGPHVLPVGKSPGFVSVCVLVVWSAFECGFGIVFMYPSVAYMCVRSGLSQCQAW